MDKGEQKASSRCFWGGQSVRLSECFSGTPRWTELPTESAPSPWHFVIERVEEFVHNNRSQTSFSPPLPWVRLVLPPQEGVWGSGFSQHWLHHLKWCFTSTTNTFGPVRADYGLQSPQADRSRKPNDFRNHQNWVHQHKQEDCWLIIGMHR